jgi:AraC-like DNA-binding protein
MLVGKTILDRMKSGCELLLRLGLQRNVQSGRFEAPSGASVGGFALRLGSRAKNWHKAYSACMQNCRIGRRHRQVICPVAPAASSRRLDQLSSSTAMKTRSCRSALMILIVSTREGKFAVGSTRNCHETSSRRWRRANVVSAKCHQGRPSATRGALACLNASSSGQRGSSTSSSTGLSRSPRLRPACTSASFISPGCSSRLPGARSVYQYLTSVRVERAKRLLAATDIPIVDIGAAVGYESQSHFTTVFRKVTGITPAAYRRHFGGSATTPFLRGAVAADTPLTASISARCDASGAGHD